jgi:hypothetical protein
MLEILTSLREISIIKLGNQNDIPNSLKDSNASPKMKITKEERVGARSLTHSTFGVRRACWSSRMGTRMNDKLVDYSYQSTQIKQQVG